VINVLLNVYEFDAPWAEQPLKTVLKPGMKACILTMSHGKEIPDCETWEKAYLPGGFIYPALVCPFAAYGIEEKDIAWVSIFHDTSETAAEKVRNADVLFLTGGLPDVFLERMEQLELVPLLKSYSGVVMGASAGAMVQFREYHITPDEDYDTYGYYAGLGLVDGFELEVHYAETPVQQESMNRYLRERGGTIYPMYNDGGILIRDGAMTLMGHVAEKLEAKV